ncbi:MAG: hypothetical protein ACYCY8_10185 [Burkholderiales bacterium]
MTMEMAIYISMGILIVWAFTMLAWAVWSKKQEIPDFSFLKHLRNLKMSRAQYDQFASSARIMMYLYAFLAGMSWGKGEISIATTCGALFLGLEVFLLLVRKGYLPK